MKDNRMKNVIENVAKQNGVTPEEVRKEIQLAIDEAVKTDDPNAKMIWNLLSCDGKTPSPEAVIYFLAMLCNE